MAVTKKNKRKKNENHHQIARNKIIEHQGEKKQRFSGDLITSHKKTTSVWQWKRLMPIFTFIYFIF